jgi:hypothetical protein
MLSAYFAGLVIGVFLHEQTAAMDAYSLGRDDIWTAGIITVTIILLIIIFSEKARKVKRH